ncbi:Protein K08D12.8 [Aphelenchoides avenae]|nr:Protein K08D12.8 [Aphelenchus avenae]
MHSALAYAVTAVLLFASLADAIDKTEAVGPCISGKCPDNHFCFEEECFPNRLRDTAHPKAAVEVTLGSCLNGLCPKGYDCVDDSCIRSSKNPSLAVGPCINTPTANICPEGYKCNVKDNKCYP